ncbi:HET-domain-containing protein [Dendrothele bispora CBS 962.96]|uniref:HET-domain-containing protein n=1 Tax=Dendrothele bispora (strain CBS 962.96) TaxID=1314807 RepID=A0A4S8M4I8_DENBC|nr:HET-domain-containing protein [Dendrothele bispora CBS 962.96]
MRLLNTKTFQLQEFYTDVPPYAILSHTWGKREVTFQDMQNIDAIKTSEDLQAGWDKVKRACEHAQKYLFEWIWIDSCCINKESSAEISEALNSMYQYYEDAEVCYVYLFDVSHREDPRNPNSAFRVSRWFKRGWTLQELLAPSHLVFLDKDWADLGTRQSLRDAISAITLIPVEVFKGKDITEFSIAQRMSWAAFRETTRPEDQAYSLMGLFGVNMPPIYGEGGPKAFVRLQQEIIKISDDRSIFAWIAPAGQKEPRGLLARSPYEFRASGDVSMSAIIPVEHSLYSFGNNGLHIHLPLEATSASRSGSYFLAPLHCLSKQDNKYLSLCLFQTEDERYVRCRASELILTSSSSEGLPMYSVVVKEVLASRTLKHKQQISPTLNFHIRPHPSTESHFIPFQSICDSPSPDTFYEIQETQCIKIAPPTSPKLVFLKYFFLDGSSNVLETFYLAVGTRTTVPFCALLKDLQTSDARRLFRPLRAMTHKLDTDDRMDLPLKNGGLASVALQRSSVPGTMAVELRYLPKDHSSSTFPLQTPIPTPKLGFLVPVSSHDRSCTLSLRTVSPPDFSGKTYDNRTYVSMPVPKSDGGNSLVFRVLTYAWKSAASEAEFPVHVVVGFNGSLPWIDIIPELKTLSEEAWKSYHISGQLRDLIVLNLSGHNWIHRRMMTVKERRNLQLGSHVLSFDSRPRYRTDINPPPSISSSEVPAEQPSGSGMVVDSVTKLRRGFLGLDIYVTTAMDSLHFLSSRMRSQGIDVTKISVLSLLREPPHLENCEICRASDTGNISEDGSSGGTISQLTGNSDTDW